MILKNPTNDIIQWRTYTFLPGDEVEIKSYIPPGAMQGLTVADDTPPPVPGPIVAAQTVTDAVYDIPYAPDEITITILADTDCTFKIADFGASVPLLAGEIYRCDPTYWENIGRVEITGSARIVTERVM